MASKPSQGSKTSPASKPQTQKMISVQTRLRMPACTCQARAIQERALCDRSEHQTRPAVIVFAETGRRREAGTHPERQTL